MVGFIVEGCIMQRNEGRDKKEEKKKED